MSVAPFKDRTIILTKESNLFLGGGNTVELNKTKSFTDRFLPRNGVLGGIVNKVAPRKNIILKGPTSISIEHTAAIASASGLFTSYLQPWFIQNIPITIKGQSYIGTYPLLSVADRDVERVLKGFRETLNDFSTLSGKEGDKDRFLLEINGNPQGARRFLGFIKRLSWSEDVKNPYILDYTLEFIGRNVDNAKLAKGKTNAQQASQVNAGQASGR